MIKTFTKEIEQREAKCQEVTQKIDTKKEMGGIEKRILNEDIMKEQRRAEQVEALLETTKAQVVEDVKMLRSNEKRHEEII